MLSVVDLIEAGTMSRDLAAYCLAAIGGGASFLVGAMPGGAGEATGWGRTTPEKPDPFFAFTQRNYLMVGWLERIRTAAYGDIDGDGLPDVAMLTADENGAAVKIYLNKKGRFADKPDLVQEVPEAVAKNPHIRLVRLGGGKVADLFVAGEAQAVLLVGQDGKLPYRAVDLGDVQRASHAIAGDFNNDGRMELLLGHRFNASFSLLTQTQDGRFRVARTKAKPLSYFDMQLIDVNGDGRDDLVTSGGEIYLRQADGSLPEEPSMRLSVPAEGWKFMAAADFNADKRPDVVILWKKEEPQKKDKKTAVNASVFYHSGDPRQPFKEKPDATFNLPDADVLRDGPTIADWNGDGVADLVLPSPEGAVILLGSPQGLSAQRTARVRLDYAFHYDTRFGAADFNGDGKTDLAGWGPSPVGAAAVYIWLQP